MSNSFSGLILDGPNAGNRLEHFTNVFTFLDHGRERFVPMPGDAPPPNLVAQQVFMQFVAFDFVIGRTPKRHGYWLTLNGASLQADAELREKALTILEQGFEP